MAPRIFRAVATAAVFGLVSAPPPVHAQHTISGKWELRDRAAADSAARAEEAAERETFERPPSPAAGGERGERARRFGPNDRERRQIGLLLGMAQTVPAFEIAVLDSTIVVTNEGGFSYTLYPDGRTTELPLQDDLTVEVQARWKDGSLEVAFEPEGGGKITEAYFLADSGLFLRLEVTVEHGRLPRRIWRSRMYRRVDAAPEM